VNLSIPDLWRRLSGKPGGRLLFSFLVGRFARYSGSIGARVQELEPGKSVLTLRDRPRVRNHLGSVHATALATFGELASGLAMLAGMPKDGRAIVTKLEIEYLQKARGVLTAYGKAPIPPNAERQEYVVHASIRNTGDEEVARLQVQWLVGPNPSGQGR
jgi:acyl-coenzyme A thioesterase PaaI-like protein